MPATLADVFVYPVKSLDPHAVETATVGAGGSLALDRRYAVFDEADDYVNGKATAAVHRLRSSFDPDVPALELRVEGSEETHRFNLDAERGDLNAFLSDYFGEGVFVSRDGGLGYPDDTHASGPTIVSTGTLAEVGSWFDVSAAEMRLRLRPNLVVDAEPFWEDRLYADRDSVVRFEVGEAAFEGVNPCQRCVVPSRDPHTGAETEGFRERFVEKRRETRPEWANDDWFDHDFRLMVNTHTPESTVGADLSVGDEVRIGETVER